MKNIYPLEIIKDLVRADCVPEIESVGLACDEN